jgi:hypothetical protein
MYHISFVEKPPRCRRQQAPGLRHRFGSSQPQQNGSLSHPRISHPQDLDAPLCLAALRKTNGALRKTNGYRQQYADNHNISFLPAIVSTSHRMHGEFLRLLFLQVHRETEAHFTANELPSPRTNSDTFRYRRAAFYQGLKSKVGLAAAKAAALRINLNVGSCSVVAPPLHAPWHTSLLHPLLSSDRWSVFLFLASQSLHKQKKIKTKIRRSKRHKKISLLFVTS